MKKNAFHLNYFSGEKMFFVLRFIPVTVVNQTIFSFHSKKDLNLIKKGIIYSEKMRNSDNYN